jgi:hypothetical protein
VDILESKIFSTMKSASAGCRVLVLLLAGGPGLAASPMRTPELACVGRGVAYKRLRKKVNIKERALSLLLS